MRIRGAVRDCLKLIDKRDRRLLALATVIQMGTSLLDLVGVLLIGLVGALAVTTVQGQPPPQFLDQALSGLGIASPSSESLVFVIGIAAAAILLTKSVISSYLMKRVLGFLANRQAQVSARLAAKLLSSPLPQIQRRSSQETAYALIQGAGAAILGVLGQAVVALSEVALLVILGIVLLIVNPVIALCSILFFFLVASLLQFVLGQWATRVGRIAADSDVASLNTIQEVLGAYREVSLTGRLGYYVSEIRNLRLKSSFALSNQQFIMMLPKYIFEGALVVGGFLLAVALFSTQGPAAAAGTLGLFLAAGTRIMPSLLRLQSATLGLRSSAEMAAMTLSLESSIEGPLEEDAALLDKDTPPPRSRDGSDSMAPGIKLENVTFTHTATSWPAVCLVSFEIPPGSSLALVGKSGAGKSTLADLILGILSPDSGLVTLDGRNAKEFVRLHPGSIGYVAQDVFLSDNTIRSNVALGVPFDEIDDALVWKALTRAHLSEFVRRTAEGVHTRVGERGVKLSGGQRQRLGIARALYSNPRLIVLDEATSALDAETEAAVTQMIKELEGDVTTIVIAHRLSTVRHADCLVYLEEGRMMGSGTFEEVRGQVPALDRQADLMGLRGITAEEDQNS